MCCALPKSAKHQHTQDRRKLASKGKGDDIHTAITSKWKDLES